MDSKISCKILTWEQVDELCRKTAASVQEAGYKPDLIIGLARGGWFTARVLCDLLGVKELLSLKVEHWGVTAQPDGKATIRYPFNVDLAGKKVLIADDITDTGESMKLAKEFLSQMNPKALKTAVLQHISKTSTFTPDFYGESVDWHWYVYPWNFMEDMTNLVPKTLKKGEEAITQKQLNERLQQNYAFTLPDKKMSEMLEQLEKKGALKKHDGKWQL